MPTTTSITHAAAALAALTLVAGLASAQTPPPRSAAIMPLTGVIDGYEVGGVSVDMIGNLYVGDFGNSVWRITPEGRREEIASGMYGTAGNAITSTGALVQASHYANTLTRIERSGETSEIATGLDRPAGVAIHRQTGEIFVANCRANTISRVRNDGVVTVFARSDHFNCPYGLAFDRDGNLYTVNYRDNRMLRIDANGAVREFARVSDGGLGYLCFKDDRFYVTAFWSHAVYEVTLGGDARRILGNSQRGLRDGAGEAARLTFPAGIGCHPWAPRLYVAEDVNEGRLPRQSIIRVITLSE